MKEIFSLFVVLMPLAGWLTHIFTCFASEKWGFLIAGAIFFPIGIFHGWWLWFFG
jgi:putative Mn2+ efflux pump MntP